MIMRSGEPAGGTRAGGTVAGRPPAGGAAAAGIAGQGAEAASTVPFGEIRRLPSGSATTAESAPNTRRVLSTVVASACAPRAAAARTAATSADAGQAPS